ncbi:MAG: queuosine precursor transporter [Candidatus Gastranaerophilaceae bacterium]
MNEILFFITLIVNFTAVLMAYKFFGKKGLFAWIGMATIIANIEVLKCVDIFGMALTLGNVTYGSIFLATDILNEKYGVKIAQKSVYLGFFALLVFTVITQVDLLYLSNEADFAGNAMKTLFTITPRMCFASMFAYFISNMLDVYLYKFIKFRLPSDKFLWIRNNVATIISQLFDTALFTYIGFAGVFSGDIVFQLFITTYLIKIIIALCDTPFLYVAKKIYEESSHD